MDFYKSDIFAILRENAGAHHFRLLDERVGILPIFGENLALKCILVESWNRDFDNISREENDAINIAKIICGRTNTPFYFLKYGNNSINNQTQIIVQTSCDSNDKWDLRDSNALVSSDSNVSSDSSEICDSSDSNNALDSFHRTNIYDFFAHFTGDSKANFKILGDCKSVHKAINDSISTPFHAWQRRYLRYDGFPVDLDMVYYDGELRAVVEIKRSFVQGWKPYRADAKNYLALCKLCNLLEVNFFLFFIPQRSENGVKMDDYGHIKIYDIYHRIGNYQNSDDLVFKVRGETSLDELMRKDFDFFRTPLPNNTWMKN